MKPCEPKEMAAAPNTSSPISFRTAFSQPITSSPAKVAAMLEPRRPEDDEINVFMHRAKEWKDAPRLYNANSSFWGEFTSEVTNGNLDRVSTLSLRLQCLKKVT